MPKPKIGEVFQERYLILSELGAGGMGFVFRARQIDADREVALKSIRSEEVRDEDTIARFYREFKLLSRLSHPNIVTIYGLALDDNSLPFAISELIEGENLRSLLSRDGAFKWERASKIVLQICLAMQYAHEQGIIHRDLKPDNVMLLALPEPDFVKLVDFGLSRVAQSDGELSQALTATGQLIGSANYMSPELIKQRADERSDIYSLGCLFYELLSAQMLFDADTAVGVIYKHCNEDPSVRFSEIKSQLPKRLLTILSKMLAKNPQERYQSMKELAADLQDLHESPGTFISDFQNLESEKRQKSMFNKPIVLAIAFLFLVIVALTANLVSMKKNEPSSNATSASNSAKDALLPRRGVSAIAILMREENLESRKALAMKWLSKYKPASVSAEDRLMVLDCLARTQIRMEELEDGLKTLRAIVDLFPSVPEATFGQRVTKEYSYRLLEETNLTLPNNNGAASAAISCLEMIKRGGELNMGMVDVSQYSIITLLLCGRHQVALDLYAPFKETMNQFTGNASSHYFQLLGDLQVCNDRTSDAMASYVKARKVLVGIPEKASQINQWVAVEVGKDGYTGNGTYSGLPMFSLASRLCYLDRERGLKTLHESLDLIEREQVKGLNLKTGQAISRAYGTYKLPASVWLQMAIAARELRAFAEELRCVSMALRVAEIEIDKNELDSKFCLSSARRAQVLVESGCFEEGKNQFEKLSQYFNQYKSPTRYLFECIYASDIAVAAFSKGDASAKNYAEQSINAWKSWSNFSDEPKADLLIALANSFAVAKQDSKAKQYWKLGADKVRKKRADLDASDFSVLTGLVPDSKDARVLNTLMLYSGAVNLVESYLRFDRVQEAEKYALVFSSEPDAESKAVAFYRIAEYYFEHKNRARAADYYKKADAEFMQARKSIAQGYGLPFTLRCRLMLNQCKNP